MQELEQLTALCTQMDAIAEPDKAKLEKFFATEVAVVKAKAEEERLKAIQDAKKVKSEQPEVADKSVWTQNEINLLFKVVKSILFRFS